MSWGNYQQQHVSRRVSKCIKLFRVLTVAIKKEGRRLIRLSDHIFRRPYFVYRRSLLPINKLENSKHYSNRYGLV